MARSKAAPAPELERTGHDEHNFSSLRVIQRKCIASCAVLQWGNGSMLSATFVRLECRVASAVRKMCFRDI